MPSPRYIRKENKVLLHLLFCLIVLATLFMAVYFYTNGEGDFRITVYSSLLFLLCIYTGRYVCMQWFRRNSLGLLALHTVVAITSLLTVWWLVHKYLLGHPHVDWVELSASIGPFFMMGLVIGMLLKLISTTLQKQVQEASMAAEQKKTELHLLQSRLSPHFLFNTLNNMYSISVVQQERIPGLILKLSELLRYTVYDTQASSLPLAQELAYIETYIAFEKIRIGDRLQLEVELGAYSPEVHIPPMLLIVFVENAFKHAKNTFSDKIYIRIALRQTDEDILFTVVNSFVEGPQPLAESSGIGLSTTDKRLKILYGNDYSLHRECRDGLYTIQLRLNLKKTTL
ncbi:histidine kinase [Pseudoflavitalea sp. X16]|uniref:sensor histidine kinase n=1 Tax=Paraflavitalea devenefica TaxID=2716334 RepID=UPI001422181E|nr:histidine kinase [Paraflavitalea devenefica]NII28986.1 histidine kinase [Paraflavitalea devenefica]